MTTQTTGTGSLCLPPGYVRRLDARPFDDCGNTDRWQDDVYALARRLAQPEDTVVDVGTGSGFKLAKHFDAPFHRIGYDVQATVMRLRDREKAEPTGIDWRTGPDETHWTLADVVICADVIEHVKNPIELLTVIGYMRFRVAVFSTPDRARLEDKGWQAPGGPPRNPSHVQEWAPCEFVALLGAAFPRHRIETREPSGSSMVFVVHWRR